MPDFNMSETFCLSCKRKTPTVNQETRTLRNNRTIESGNCNVCGRRKSTFKASKSKADTNISASKIAMIRDTYYDPEKGFCGVNELRRNTSCPLASTKELIEEQDVYTKFKPLRHRH